MNKSQLIDRLATRAGIPRVRAEKYVNALLDDIRETLVSGESVTISGFGRFAVGVRVPFQGSNPKTGKPVQVPLRRIPVFRAGKGLKAALNVEE